MSGFIFFTMRKKQRLVYLFHTLAPPALPAISSQEAKDEAAIAESRRAFFQDMLMPTKRVRYG